MPQIPTKSVDGFSLPALGLGTYAIGGKRERDAHNDDARDIATIRAAIQQGMIHLDTAEVYARGYTEQLVAQAIQGVERSQLFITSKVAAGHLRRDDVRRACEGSLRRLGVSYLDLYLVHAPHPDIPLAETMAAMDALVDDKLVRHIGVSNFDVPLLEAAQGHARHPIVTNQIHLSLSARGYLDNGTIGYCRTHGVLVTAYRPLGTKGELAQPAAQAVLRLIGTKYQKTPVQVALNWVIRQPNVVALVKTSNPEHLTEDLDALGWQLSDDDARQLAEQFPVGETINLPGAPDTLKRILNW